MNTLEKEALSLRRKGYVQDALLCAVGVSGLLLMSAMAPNMLQLIGKFGGNKYKFNYRLKSVASRLAKKGLVRFVDRNGKKCMEITEQGRAVLLAQEQRFAIKTRSRKRWDKRWRMVVFDIPERRRVTRDKLRDTLRSLGFVQMQASVWVYPYDCEELITLLKTELHTGASVLYTIVEKIENDSALRRHFNLR